ncbi:MAG: aminotransferase class V-fold PLP-dependent enzyme [Bacilli bacterium]|nr:aminotransferase class V-fold PLP-dependent enzyme [Bacilli bacterium]
MYDVYKIRKQFPMLTNNIKMQNKPLTFLDNCSTTFKPQCVIDAMNEYYTKYTSNSHRGDYDLSVNADTKIEEARKEIASLVNSEVNEVVFTTGATGALNLVAYGYGLKYLKKGDEIILSVAEHASNVLPWFRIAELTGATIKYVEIVNGRILAENLRKVISNKTKIVSLAHVGNVLGYVADIKEFAKIAHEYGAIMVCDGAQSVPHIKTDFKDLDVDFLAFSAHKMCGPTGVGALVGKYELLQKMDPFTTGGGMNSVFKKDGTVDYRLPPYKFEAGTLDVAGIIGFGRAVKFIKEIGIDNIHKHDQELIDYALEKLKDYKDIIIYNKDARNGILTFNIKGVFPQDEATLMNYKGIAIRSGEHCAKLLDNYLDTKATCRMSTYLYTTKEEIDVFVDAIINGGDILDAYFN